MALAEKASHPHTLVYTMCHARGFMDLFRRHHKDMRAYASLVISICNENGFLHWPTAVRFSMAGPQCVGTR
jgi:hypothetical protein